MFTALKKPEQPQVDTEKSIKRVSKKSLIFKILLVIILLILGLILWYQHKQSQLSQIKQNLVELPEATDPNSLAENQQQALVKGIQDKYPNQTFTTSTQTSLPIIQNIIITQNNQPIAFGQTPTQGGVTIPATSPQKPTPTPTSASSPAPTQAPTKAPTSSPKPTITPRVTTSPTAGVTQSPSPSAGTGSGDHSYYVESGKYTCEDFDGGLIYYEKSHIKATGPGINNDTYYDECDGDYLTERYCSVDARGQSWRHRCPYGCNDGACQDEEQAESGGFQMVDSENCTETDDGFDYNHFGTLDDGSGSISEDICMWDHRPDLFVDENSETYQMFENTLVEKSCKMLDYSNVPEGARTLSIIMDGDNYHFQIYYDCPSGCYQGQCIDPESVLCHDTDGGKDYYTKGETGFLMFGSTDECADDYAVTEYYCDPNSHVPKVLHETRLCPDGCNDGACNVPEGGACIDTDDGLDYYQWGFAGMNSTNPVGEELIMDTCEGNTLMEAFCIDEYYVSRKPYECEYGCTSGVCNTSLGAPASQIPEIEYSGFPSETLKEEDLKQKLEELKDLVEMFLPHVLDEFGSFNEAHLRKLHFQFVPDANQNNYLAQYDTVVISSTDPAVVLTGLMSAFQGQYSSKIPETLKYGSQFAAANEILQKTGKTPLYTQKDVDLAKNSFSKLGAKRYPIQAMRVFYDNDVLSTQDRVILAADTLAQMKKEDKNLFKNLNKAFYQIPEDAKVWKNTDKIMQNVSKKVPKISFEWLESQEYLKKKPGLYIAETIQSQLKNQDFPNQSMKDLPKQEFEGSITPTPEKEEESVDIDPTAQCIKIGDTGLDPSTPGAIYSYGKWLTMDACVEGEANIIIESSCSPPPGNMVGNLLDNGISYAVKVDCPSGYTCQNGDKKGSACGLGSSAGLSPTAASTDNETVLEGNWNVYENPKFPYKIKYKEDWHKQGNNEPPYPPPPAGMSFSKKWDSKGLFSCSFSILNANSEDGYDGEIENLSADFNQDTYTKGAGTVDGIASVTFTYDQNTTVNGIPALNYGVSHYIKYKGNAYRIGYGGMLEKESDLEECIKISKQMLSSINFD